MITIGLVMEGDYDYVSLPPFISSEITNRSIDQIRFRVLQPMPDESGKLSSGGWRGVVAWCLEYSGESIETFFAPLFEGDPACDVIVVHIDGDSYGAIISYIEGGDVRPPTSATARVKAIVAALEDWLTPTAERRAKLAFAVPVLHTEAWIIAAESIVHDCENFEAKDEFLRLYSQSKHGPKGNFYRIRAEEGAKNTELISKQCASYRLFSEEIRKLSFSS
jgi:hypothetical protein